MGEGFKVIPGPRSRSDLREIVSYVAKASGSPVIAERLGVQLLEKAPSLSSFPERGRIVPELQQPDIREIIFKSYCIVYRIMGSHVQILRFWHAARGAPNISLDEFEP